MDIFLVKTLIPEIFLSFCVLSHLLFNTFLLQKGSINFPLLDKEYLFQCLFILSCCLLLLFKLKIEGIFFNFLFITSIGTTYIKILILFFSIFILFSSWRHFSVEKLNFVEFFNLFLLAILIFLLLLNANDLLVVYLLLEMQSLIFYILANFKRSSAFSTEAGLKYFISGSLFSGIFLLGCSFLYGILGTVNFYSLELLLSIPLNNFFLHLTILIAIFLVTSMFLFKLAIAPFHVWSPDVYEGAPLGSTIFLSTIPKLVILSVLMHWLSVVYYIVIDFYYIFLILGLFSIFFGIFFANRQKRLKKFIIYSSISQFGYIIMLLGNITYDTYASAYFFIIIYLIASVTLWIFLTFFDTFNIKTSIFNNKERNSIYISSFSNYFTYNKFWSIFLLIIFASLAGIPPISGFLPKLLVFIAITEYQKWFINILLVILSCLVIWYYINIITILFMEITIKTFKYSFKPFFEYHFKLYLDEVEYIICCLSIFLLLYLFINPSCLYIFCQFFSIFLL